MSPSVTRINRRQFTRSVVAGGAAVASFSPFPITAKEPAQLTAGAAEVIVTPAAEGTFLIGPMQPSTGVHDDLYARALVLTSGEERVAIVTLDYLGFDLAYTNRLLAAASQAAGIPRERIMLNCSHTHSAPLTAPWGPWKEHRTDAFYDMLPKKVAEVVGRASDQQHPARVRYRREPTQIGFNRRLFDGEKIQMAPNPQGAVLPWVDVLAVDRFDGQSLAVLFSHAAHPVIVHQASTLISADYPGFAVQTLKQARGDDAVYLFAQGCSGNINAFPLQGGLEAAAAAGRDLGQAVARALARMGDQLTATTIGWQVLELELPLQQPPSVEKCREMMQQEQNPQRRQRFAELLAIAQAGQPRIMRMPIRVFALGEFCLVGMAHEPFAEYHHYVNEICPLKHNMVLGYTNGLECYVGTRQDYQLGDRGGYETSPRGAAFMFESRLPLAPESERVVQTGLKRVLNAVRQPR